MNSLEEIRSCHGRLVWNTVYRVLRDYADALDCYQDVFCEVLQQAETHQVASWPAYLRWLATRRAIDRLRTRRRRLSRFEPGDASLAQAPNPGPSETAQLNELVEVVRSELVKLPERQAEAFWLCSIEEMTYEEVGRQLSIDPSTVGVLVHRARLHLRKVLTDHRPTGRPIGDKRHG